MLPNLAIVSLLLLVVPVMGKTNFCLKRSFNLGPGLNLADTDRARAKSLKLPRDIHGDVGKRKQPPSISVTNQGVRSIVLRSGKVLNNIGRLHTQR